MGDLCGGGVGVIFRGGAHGLALVPYVGGVAYGAEAVGVFEDFEHVGDVVRRFLGRFGVGYAVEVRAQNHPVAIVDSIFDALFPFRRSSHRQGGFFVSHTQNTGIDCPLFTNYSYLCQCIL